MDTEQIFHLKSQLQPFVYDLYNSSKALHSLLSCGYKPVVSSAAPEPEVSIDDLSARVEW